MNLIASTVPESGAGVDPVANAFDKPYAVSALSSAAPALGAASQGLAMFTRSGVVAATLALPVAGLPSAGGNDGQELAFFDTTGYAHTITTPSNGVNGAYHIITFGGLVGQFCILYAYNGSWWLASSVGVTVS